MPGETLIGIDIGTTSFKAVLTDLDGSILAQRQAEYAVERPRPGFAEQSPERWLELTLETLDAFANDEGLGDLRGLGVAGQVNTHVFVDRQRRALRPAISWQDIRASDDAASLDAAVTPTEKHAWFGAQMPIDASNALARMVWVAREEPEVWARTDLVLSPKDYVVARLTTEPVADPIGSVGLVGQELQYVQPFLERVPGAQERMAMLRDPLARAGTIRHGLPGEGAPVAVGTMDAWAAMFGVGAAQHGDAMYLSGTSDVVGQISNERHDGPGIVSFPMWRGIGLHAGPTQVGGAALSWACRLLGRETPAVLRLAAAESITSTSPIFLPHLSGERAPIWDAEARGAFAGFRTEHGPGTAALAILEGVAFSARWVLEGTETAAGHRAGLLYAGGGGMRSDFWMQVRANALGRPLARTAGGESAARGAALMAGVSSGQFADLAATAKQWAGSADRFEPDPAAAELSAQRFNIFKDFYQALRPINAALA